jgi:hypothetical protein
VNLGSTVAVLLPAPLSGPVNAQLSTALTRVATTSGHGWYAVLQVQPGRAQDVLDTLADGLVDAGYQVELSDGHISATLLAADAPVTMPLPDAALPSEPAAVPSPSESATPTPTASASQDPGAGDLPGLALTPAVPAFPGGVKTTPGEPVPLVGTWVEVHLMGVQAGPDTPRPDREFITVSFVERLT